MNFIKNSKRLRYNNDLSRWREIAKAVIPSLACLVLAHLSYGLDNQNGVLLTPKATSGLLVLLAVAWLIVSYPRHHVVWLEPKTITGNLTNDDWLKIVHWIFGRLLVSKRKFIQIAQIRAKDDNDYSWLRESVQIRVSSEDRVYFELCYETYLGFKHLCRIYITIE